MLKIKHSTNGNVILYSHNAKELAEMVDSEIDLLACVDDGVVFLNDIESVITGSRESCEVISEMGPNGT